MPTVLQPLSETTQLSFPPYVSDTPRVTVSAGAQGECLRVSLCGSFTRTSGFPRCLPSHLGDQNPHCFSQPDVAGRGGSSSQHQYSGLGRTVWGWGSLLLWGEPLQLRYPFRFSTATRRFGVSQLCVSTPPTSLDVASLYP